MPVLSVDIETYSDVSLPDCGVYKYVDTDEFRILLFAYAFGDEPVEVVDFESGETLPKQVMNALVDSTITKTAFNAQFERVCINKHFSITTDNWECTMIKALTWISRNLDSVGRVLEPDHRN